MCAFVSFPNKLLKYFNIAHTRSIIIYPKLPFFSFTNIHSKAIVNLLRPCHVNYRIAQLETELQELKCSMKKMRNDYELRLAM